MERRPSVCHLRRRPVRCLRGSLCLRWWLRMVAWGLCDKLARYSSVHVAIIHTLPLRLLRWFGMTVGGMLRVLEWHVLHIIAIGIKEPRTDLCWNVRILPSRLLASIVLGFVIVASLPSLSLLWVLLLVCGRSRRAMLSLRLSRASRLRWWSCAHG